MTASGASLERAVVSIAKTQRGRFFWAAWWTGAPTFAPFRKPDASGGGASDWYAARADAERTTGRALAEIDSEWAHAFLRTLRGQPAFNDGQRRRALGEAPAPRPKALQPTSIWDTLGVSASATEIEIRRAYRLRALETHPDRGGTDEAFRAVRAAYDEALRRKRKRA
ncbi:MAG: DnaJ domain-containing protein [Deltaproteobacteria bacterium]|nr:DnaJ domain-containing protein [Deltaproteobacteria bacterium]